MTNEQPLKLIIAHDRTRNEVAVAAHNQTSEEADHFLEQWKPHLRPDSSFVVLPQTRRHQTEDSQKCRACRETVLCSANIEPQPKFKRRNA